MFILDELIGRDKIHVHVEGIKAKLHGLSESRISYGIANIGETGGTSKHSRSQDVIPILPQLNDDIDDEKKKIVKEVADISNTDRSVIAIVGMGGLRKTTLAKSIYNDHDVKRSFAKLAWVIISQEYTILDILKRISSEVSATSSRDEIQDLSVAISEKLKKGKYLVILDDVWKKDVWDQLQKVFPNVNNGSRVIITTHFLNVAKIANPTIQPHELSLLNEKESMELFLRKVFPRQDTETCCPIDLVDYAHQLFQRCSGLPLALVVTGGLMSTKPKSRDAWQKVFESMKRQFVEGNVLPKLTNLLKLKIYDVSNDHASALSSSLQKLGRLIQGDVIPLDNIITAFSNQHCLKKLKLNGRLNCKELPRTDVFPHPLVKLTLINSNLEQDPMPTLEKLQSLKYLQLFRSYIGKKMICSATGFPQLLTLDIEYFLELEEWKIEEKAMPCLKYLNLSACLELKVVLEGLKNVPLDELVLHFMPEDWSKIQYVPNFSCH
ncbi:probable disease resistance protein At1g58390 [Dioscorea cayenensis subsp. rotundata]|uniref:Probable disease resistance protein At1g58390 n=1 Tax=Dioscorea cayennensis subsp. rotundata TaxID=55577 RepID=A0AB40AWD8_DIOCR|nr:probable disease resistance protein At1g58390 [Dioscorea cayenensis subsp. rotundata]